MLFKPKALNYPLAKNSIVIGKKSFDIFSIENTDSLYESLLAQEKAAEEIEEHLIPYWAEVWPSAIGLARFIDKNNTELKNKHVVEVGCGLGLPGIVAGSYGAKVTFTDIIQEALNVTEKNWKENIKVKNADYQIVDWRVDHLPKADIYLASDIAYESKQFEQQIYLFKELLKPNCQIWLAEPGRSLTKPFIDQLQKKFSITSSENYIIDHIGNFNVVVYRLSQAG